MEGAGVGKPPVKEPARGWAGQRRKRYGDFNVSVAQVGSTSCDCERLGRKTELARRASIAVVLWTASPSAASIRRFSQSSTERLRARMMTGVGERHRRYGWILITTGALAWQRGLHPRSKTSMIRMRPPQQGQDCSGRSGACASGLAASGAGAASNARMRARFPGAGGASEEAVKWWMRCSAFGRTWMRKRRMNSCVASVMVV
jgi:hypothetical protein